MLKRSSILYILALSLIFAHCKKPDDRACFKGIGEDVIEERSLGSFQAIVISNHIDLKLIEDTLDWAKVESGENLINFIVTEISNDTLFIRDENRCDFLRDLNYKSTVTIRSSNLNYLKTLGSGNIETVNSITKKIEVSGDHANGNIDLELNCDTARIVINVGVTHATIRGANAYTYFYYFGNSDIDASDLISDKVLLNWQSTGILKTSVVNSISGEIGASGDVFYSGSPSTINVGLSGSGKLIAQ
ncbi:MAG: hypothetical protein ACI9J3_003482 [Parvicellaceae bacterium]|jgi:hypothetical protein